MPRELSEVVSDGVDNWDLVLTNKNTPRVSVCGHLDAVVVRNLVLFIDDRLLGGTIAGGYVACLMSNDERNPSGFVVLITKQHDRSTIGDTGHALKPGGGRDCQGDNRDASLP